MPGAESGSSAVVDASVAVKWVMDEPGSKAAAALLERPILWLAPRLLVVEVAAAIRRKVARGEVRLADDEAIVTNALLLSVDLEHKVPDCLYLALAEREGCALSTADLRLARLARSRNVPVIDVGAAAR